jgi:hypothetical protein
MHVDWTCTILGLAAALASMVGALAAAWVAVVTIREHRGFMANVVELISSNASILKMLTERRQTQSE